MLKRVWMIFFRPHVFHRRSECFFLLRWPHRKHPYWRVCAIWRLRLSFWLDEITHCNLYSSLNLHTVYYIPYIINRKSYKWLISRHLKIGPNIKSLIYKRGPLYCTKYIFNSSNFHTFLGFDQERPDFLTFLFLSVHKCSIKQLKIYRVERKTKNKPKNYSFFQNISIF